MVYISEKTTVDLRPAERKLRTGEKATFSCSVTSDHNELPFLETSWFKNDEPIDSDDPNIEMSEDMLTILKISSKDSANYSCHADNKVDTATAVSQLKVEGLLIKYCCVKSCQLVPVPLILAWYPQRNGV